MVHCWLLLVHGSRRHAPPGVLDDNDGGGGICLLSVQKQTNENCGTGSWGRTTGLTAATVPVDDEPLPQPRQQQQQPPPLARCHPPQVEG